MLTLLPDIYFRVMNMSNFYKHIYLSWSRKIEFLPESNRKTFMRAGWGVTVTMMLEQVRSQLGGEVTQT